MTTPIVEECIFFWHFRTVPTRAEVRKIKRTIAKWREAQSVAPVLVTLPNAFRSVMRPPQRYAFETLVIEAGGMLAFVEYEPSGADPAVNYAAVDEAEYRAGIIASLRNWTPGACECKRLVPKAYPTQRDIERAGAEARIAELEAEGSELRQAQHGNLATLAEAVAEIGRLRAALREARSR